MPKTLTVFEVRDGRDATVGSITVPRSGGIRFETALERSVRASAKEARL